MENFAGNLEEIFITVEVIGLFYYSCAVSVMNNRVPDYRQSRNFASLQENFGRQEQNLEQHYNEVLQTLAHRYDLRASALEDEKKMKLESLYNQLIDCGRTLDTNKEQIEEAQALYRDENKYLFLQVSSLCKKTNCHKFIYFFILVVCLYDFEYHLTDSKAHYEEVSTSDGCDPMAV